MSLKEAVLKSLEDINDVTNYWAVLEHINANNYYDFGEAKTPGSTVSAILGDFIRNGDIRVKRIKQNGSTYSYYLTKNEHKIDLEIISGETNPTVDSKLIAKNKIITYDERSLHKLLSSFLKNTDTYSKTIFHEHSNGKDYNQIWTHPDMVGVKFLNYGYLVAFEFSDSLYDEMERLNQSFGIGIIELDANPYQSKILFPAKYRDLDFKTIDKLCNMNNEFEKFIVQIEKLLSASDKYVSGAEKELDEYCDMYFSNDAEIEGYCTEKNIPIAIEC